MVMGGFVPPIRCGEDVLSLTICEETDVNMIAIGSSYVCKGADLI